jgi:hypothetical protein
MSEWATAGDNVELGLSGVELNEVSAGRILLYVPIPLRSYFFSFPKKYCLRDGRYSK